MGSKGDAPAAPDYTSAVKAMGDVSQQNINAQTFANRANTYTPWGSQTWSQQSTIDPSTGKPVTSWQQNINLNPSAQNALDSQMSLQAGRSDLANQMLGQVAQGYSNPIDYSSLPAMTMAKAPGSLQTGLNDYTQGLQTNVNPNTSNLVSGFNYGGPATSVNGMTGDVQRGLNTSDNPGIPQFDSSYRDTVANQLMQKMQPSQDYATRQLETKLSNQGLRPGSEAYNRAMTQLGNQQSMERYNALDQAGNEAQRLYNMQMGSAQQAFNQDLQGGQFANQAVNQAYNQNLGAFNFGNNAQNQAYTQAMGMANLNNQTAAQGFNQNLQAANFGNSALNQASSQDIARMQAQNQAMGQQYGLNAQQAAAQNALRQQALAEQLQARSQPLNDLNSLLSGQQVQYPNFSSYSNAGLAQTPDLMGAMNNSYNAQLGSYNAQQAGMNNILGAGAQLGAAYMLSPYAFSDRRLKSNIKKVGDHAIGVGIYEYTMMGMPQRGVIAQEVQAVRPDLVKRHANGFLMVNYGGL